MTTPRTPFLERAAWPGWLPLIGGLLTVIGVFLRWVVKDVSRVVPPPPPDVSLEEFRSIRLDAHGLDTPTGPYVMALGCLAALLGIAWAMAMAGRSRWYGAPGLVASVAVVALVAWQWTRIDTWVVDTWPASWGDAADSQAAVTARPGLGIYLALAGGVLSTVGAACAALVPSRRH